MKVRVLSILTAVALCLSVAGCSSPAGTDAAQEKNTGNAAAQSHYAALRCDGQDFSLLYRSDSFGVSRLDGASIYPEKDVALNRVDVSVIHDGDTAGWDAAEYFFFRPEQMEQQDGNQYTVAEAYSQTPMGASVMHRAVYSFETEDGTVFRDERVLDTGSRLVSFSCYYYEGEQSGPVTALTDAIRSYQPSAGYYDSHPAVINDAPLPSGGSEPQSPVPQQAQGANPAAPLSFRAERTTPIIADTALYDGGSFTVELPAGWQISTAGSHTNFSFYAFDPAVPERRMFFFCKLEPLLKSEKAKAERQSMAAMVADHDPYGYHLFAAVPVLDPATFPNFLNVYYDLIAAAAAYPELCIPHRYPDLNDVQVIDAYKNNTPTAPTCRDNAIVRALFTSDSGIGCQGLFAGQVTDKMSGASPATGTDLGFCCVYNFMGISAPEAEFLELQDTLSRCLSSFAFTQAYLDETRQAISDQTDAILAKNRSMQAAYDSYNAAWRARQTSYDIISQKNSDATLGYDRLYDPDTGETYRAQVGFYDNYDLNREQYQNSNLQRVDGSAENYYLEGVDYYIYQ